MHNRHLYFLGVGAWYYSYGIQSVVFAWLVTIVLHESPEMVGIAQMTYLAPALVLMLVGGSLADQYGGKPVSVVGQAFAAICLAGLIVATLLDRFNYSILLLFALGMGCAQALITPARDGLLALIAGGQIQRRVVQASMIQFSVQMLGFLTAAMADQMGVVIILSIQLIALIAGTFAFRQLQVPILDRPPRTASNPMGNLFRSIGEGIATVRQSPSMTSVVLLNCAMGLFFMGSYIVTVPLLVRELYGGNSSQLAWVNSANALGLVITIFCLLRFGDIHRQGRALLFSFICGSLVLATAGLALGFSLLIATVFVWGMCGGIAMTMSRTIMQEQAPPHQRARIMAFFSFSFMGAGPVGALLNGYLVQWLGAATTIIVDGFAMFIITLIMAIRSTLWDLDGRHHASVTL